jgi:hypothetical protein
MYFDELKNHHHRTLPPHGLAVAFYAKPQDPEFAELLYRGAVNFLGWDNPSVPISNEFMPDPRMFALGLTVSKEFDDQITYERLKKYSEENFEPRFFGPNDSHFGFWFNLGENWPRGQLSALAMCAEVCEAEAWENLFNRPNFSKYYSPSIQGVDFPSLYISQAHHDDEEGKLYFNILDGDKTKSYQPTSIEVFNLPDTENLRILCDGKQFNSFENISSTEILIHTDIRHHEFEIETGYFLSKEEKQALNQKLIISDQVKQNSKRQSSSEMSSKIILPSNLNSCGCC